MNAAIKLINDTVTTKKNTDILQTDASDLNGSLLSLKNYLNDAKNLNSKLHSLEDALSTTKDLLEVVRIVPGIGEGAAFLEKVIADLEKPVADAAKVSDTIEKIVKPVRKVVTKVQPKVADVASLLRKLSTTEAKFVSKLGNVTNHISAMPKSTLKKDLNHELGSFSKPTDNLVLKFDEFQIKILDGIKDLKKDEDKVLNWFKSLHPIEKVVDDIMKTLSPVRDEMRRIKHTLNHVISLPVVPYPCHWEGPIPTKVCYVHVHFSIEEILKGISGVAGWAIKRFTDLAMDILRPLLDALHIHIHLPSLPGLDILHEIEKDFESVFGNINEKMEHLLEQLDFFEGLEKRFEEFIQSIEKIQEKVHPPTGTLTTVSAPRPLPSSVLASPFIPLT